MHLSIIIPTFNEALNLNDTIESFILYLKKQKYSYEIIIINDGSTDTTATIAKQLSNDNSSIKFIDNKINQGKGKVVCEGLKNSSGRYRLFIDADNATTIDNLDKVWPLFENGKDIIIASRSFRDHPDTLQEIKQPLWKRSLGICGNRIIQLLTVRNIWDTQCGFKIFTKEAIDIILPKMTISRWAFDVEMLVIAKSHNLKIGIIPVIWRNSESSRVGFKGYLRSLREVITIRWNILKGLYK